MEETPKVTAEEMQTLLDKSKKMIVLDGYDKLIVEEFIRRAVVALSAEESK